MLSVLAALVAAALLPSPETPAPAQPRPAESLVAAARAHAAGESERALKLAADYLRRHPGDAAATLLMVRAHIDSGDWQSAYRIASRAARAHPSNVDVHYYLGLVTRQLAAEEFARLTRLAPDSGRVRQLQAEQLERQDRGADAEKAYAAALERAPNLVEALLGLGRLQRSRLSCDEAVKQYDRAEAIRPTFEAAYGLGFCYSYLQNEEEAVKRFEQARRRNPAAAEAWAGLGTSLVRLGRTSEGIEKLQRAIALEPGLAEAHYVLGLAYRASGDDARARAAFAKAQALRTQ